MNITGIIIIIFNRYCIDQYFLNIDFSIIFSFIIRSLIEKNNIFILHIISHHILHICQIIVNVRFINLLMMYLHDGICNNDINKYDIIKYFIARTEQLYKENH